MDIRSCRKLCALVLLWTCNLTAVSAADLHIRTRHPVSSPNDGTGCRCCCRWRKYTVPGRVFEKKMELKFMNI